MSELVRVENIKKVFPKNGTDVSVLKEVSFGLDVGQSIAIVGQSGSGKSTLLQVLGTIMRPTSGRVCFRGKNIFDLSESEIVGFRRHKLGFVFQFHHLLPDFTALENVSMPLLIQGNLTDKPEKIAENWLDKVGLKDRLDHAPYALSGGEQQRVAIARALVGSPEIILADEPTGNLDFERAKEVAELLFDLARKNKIGLIMATHNLEIIHMADQVFRLKDGYLEKVR
ncbi:MAG: ABC transporter ATP-binding protein [Bdellovibrionales bacterium]|nr:ABC transporter ATP-binding protein [Bdellovibrionales bacterium]